MFHLCFYFICKELDKYKLQTSPVGYDNVIILHTTEQKYYCVGHCYLMTFIYTSELLELLTCLLLIQLILLIILLCR